jgi:branched-chain amino acid aminotransferase
MNIAFVYGGTHIRTPALTGSILPGVTRDSILRMAPDLGYTTSEDRIEIEQVLRDAESGAITEVFGMGTAAVVAPVGRLGYGDREVVVNDGRPGPVAERLFKTLTDLQFGREPDPYGWTLTISSEA